MTTSTAIPSRPAGEPIKGIRAGDEGERQGRHRPAAWRACPLPGTRESPVYPPIADAAKVAGAVIVEATIDETGRVTEARALRSIPLLDQAALEAVRQWEFEPTMLNGKPVPIVVMLTVTFPPK